METLTFNQPDFDFLKRLLLEMAEECQECPLDDILGLITRRLTERPYVALARIWLIKPGDLCDTCRFREECPDQISCLHLVASAGKPQDESGEDWSGKDGDFRRFPLGVRKVGKIGETGKPVVVMDLEKDSQWIARPEWAKKEGIRSFAGQPLIFKGMNQGVIAMFSRIPLAQENIDWLRLIADHAAAAIANARAFEEIERLRKQLELENAYLREEVLEAKAFGDIVGNSPALNNLLDQIELVAPTEAGVLILGESGTGKELVAREIHKRSQRGRHPLIKVNCASIPKDLYESEFFGHVKGAFTGALKDRAGRFTAADGGTLFLDEVGEIPLDVQTKLLRVLQEGEYERVGEERTRKANVRIIAATNRDLKQEVEAGRFRLDLFYRLNVFPIEVVPLRQRKNDIPLLASHFLKQVSSNLNRTTPRLTKANVADLQRYDWPGNVRELQNVIERSLIISRGDRLRFDLPGNGEESRMHAVALSPDSSEDEVISEEEIRHRERENILTALRKTEWRIRGEDGAAALLGINPTTLASRIKKMEIKRPI